MNNQLKIIFSSIFLMITVFCFAQEKDTISISPEMLVFNNLKPGKSTYVVYNKKSKTSPEERIILVKINVESKIYHDKPAIIITQNWDMDTIVHSAFTVLNANDFSTIEHDFFWKRLGYSASFDFEKKSISYEGGVPDSVKSNSIKDFNESFTQYNLNWHSDLIVFTLLPYKENRSFKINFYDPGFGKSEKVLYTITGTDFITGSAGEQIKCWLMEYKFTQSVGYQKFWISQKTNEILKEEDFFNGRFRYKLKLVASEDN